MNIQDLKENFHLISPRIIGGQIPSLINLEGFKKNPNTPDFPSLPQIYLGGKISLNTKTSVEINSNENTIIAFCISGEVDIIYRNESKTCNSSSLILIRPHEKYLVKTLTPISKFNCYMFLIHFRRTWRHGLRRHL